MLGFWDVFILTMFLVICALLIIVVLLQKGRGGGLGAALGGIGSTAFGTRTGDVLTWVTIVLTALFLLFAIFSIMAYTPAPNTVVAPVLMPSPGQIGAPVAVTMLCATPDAQIYYTTDGSEPTEKSSIYKEPVMVLPETKLLARAFHKDYRPSATAGGLYGRQATQPAPSTEPAEMPATQPAQ